MTLAQQLGYNLVMGDTDTKVLDTTVPGPSRAVSNTRFGIESSRYRKPHPLEAF